MAGRKLVLEITTTGERVAAANVRDIRVAVESLDKSLVAAAGSATNFADAIASSAVSAREEVERLIAQINSVPPVPAPTDTFRSDGTIPPPVTGAAPPPPVTGAAPPPITPMPTAPTGGGMGGEIEAISRRTIAAIEEAKLAQTQALVEIQQLLNKEAISAEEAGRRKLGARRKGIEAEINAERQRAVQIAALPRSSDPDEEESRQQQIRGSHQKTAGLQLDLANEVGNAISQGQEKSAVGAKGLLTGIVKVAFGFNQALQSIQSFMAGGQQAYQLLIGANEQLRKQVLGSAASIVATSQVMVDGVQIKDPTAAIKAVQPKIEAAMKEVQKQTEQLVGVTDQDTMAVFNVILSKVGMLQGQSKEFKDSISASIPLTTRLVAALGTMGLDLSQASQEIGDLLAGDVGQDSTVANMLGITKPMIDDWKASGVLVDQLIAKMEPYMAGNALAAKSVEGITSNLESLFQTTLQVAGAPMLDALVVQLQQVEAFFKANKDTIQKGATSAVTYVMELLGIVGDALTQVGQILLPIGKQLGEGLGEGLEAGADVGKQSIQTLADAAVTLVKVAAPMLEIVVQLANALAQFFNTEVGKAVVSTVLLTAGLAKVATAIQLLAPAIAAIQGSFVLLGGAAAPLSAAFITAGGGIAGMGAAMTAALPAIASFGASLALALGPLIALGGLVALTITIKKTGDIKSVNDEIEQLTERATAMGEAAVKTEYELRVLRSLEKQQGGLTPEQEASRNKLLAQARLQADANKHLKESLKDLKPETEGQKGAIAGLSNELDQNNKVLQKGINLNKENKDATKAAADGVTVGSKSLERQGTLYEQLEKKAKGAQQQIDKEGYGNKEAFEKGAKDLIEVRQQQLELGKISAAQAIKDLEAIVNNEKMSAEVQQAASEGLTKIRESEGKKQVDAVAAREKDIQKLAAEGRIGEAEKERQLTANKIEELNKRLEVTKAAIAAERAAGRGSGERAGELAKEEKEIQAELAQTRADGEKAEREERVKDFDEQLAMLEAAHEEGSMSEEEYQQKRLQISTGKFDEQLSQIRTQRAKLSKTDKEGMEASLAEEAKIRTEKAKAVKEFQKAQLAERIKDLEEASQKAADATKAAETQRLIVIQQALNAGDISDQEAAQKRSDSAIQSTKAEIEQAQKRANALKAIPSPTDPEAEEDLQKKVRDAVQATAALRLKLLEQERQKQDELRKKQEQDLQRQLGVLTDATKAAETERLTAIEESLNAGAIKEEEANAQRMAATIATTQAEIEQAEIRAEAIRNMDMGAEDPQERADKIRDADQAIADNRLKLLQAQRQQEEAAEAAAKAAREKAIENAIKEIDKRAAAEDRASAQAISGIQRQAEAYDVLNRELEKEQRAQDAIAKTLDTQTKLINSRAGVEDAQRNLAIAGYQIQTTNFERAAAIQKELSNEQLKDAGVRKALQQELASLGVSAEATQVQLAQARAAAEAQILAKQREQKVAELARNRELADIDERRDRLAAQREVREAKIAENQAKQRVIQAEQEQVEARRAIRAAQFEVERAKAKGDQEEILEAEEKLRQSTEDEARTTDKVALAREDVGFAAENTKAAGDNLAIQAEVTKNSKDTLAAQQAAAMAQLNQAELSARNASNLAVARAQAEELAAQLERASAASKSIGTIGAAKLDDAAKPAGVAGSRRLGGSMEAGLPYWVGEGEGGAILPTSEIIVPETQSYAIAAHRAQEWLAAAASVQFKAPSPSGSGVQQEQIHDMLYREIGQLRQELHNLRFMNPVQYNAEYHNTFAREDEQAFLDKQRRQQVETAKQIFKRAADEFYRG